jgi:hypothetical protein
VDHRNGAYRLCLRSAGLPIIGIKQSSERLTVGCAEVPAHQRDKVWTASGLDPVEEIEDLSPFHVPVLAGNPRSVVSQMLFGHVIHSLMTLSLA